MRECLNVYSSNWAGITSRSKDSQDSLPWQLPNIHEAAELPIKIQTGDRKQSQVLAEACLSLVWMASSADREHGISIIFRATVYLPHYVYTDMNIRGTVCHFWHENNHEQMSNFKYTYVTPIYSLWKTTSNTSRVNKYKRWIIRVTFWKAVITEHYKTQVFPNKAPDY